MAPDELWRPPEASYTSLTEHLARTAGFPTYLPWPLEPGWRVADFGALGEPGRPRATMIAVHGASPEDGGVAMTVIAEEPGSGLGAHVAGTVHSDPGADIGDRPADARVRVGTSTVPLWALSTHEVAGDLDRSVLAGEAEGRWIWLVLRPASALLMLGSPWHFTDAAGIGAPLVGLPFGGEPPAR
ncbi:DUF6758 family protein [Nocardioides sp.]|uniref:DUF6758 family protein n=1 Tax=Nocardioides sp. TaxID=35761 RepID=UPI002C977797|nr:DUF6758 family protein [Nocardioides sp.]HSX67660.1 DUF6758 family protein [Nocardioides sp.]